MPTSLSAHWRHLLGPIRRRMVKSVILAHLLTIARVVRFHPRRLSLGWYPIDYGKERCRVFTSPIPMPLEKLSYNRITLAEMRMVLQSSVPTAEFRKLRQVGYQTGTELESSATDAAFYRLKELTVPGAKFVVLGELGCDGSVTILDGSHRCAVSELTGMEGINVVLGHKKYLRAQESKSSIPGARPG